MYDWPEAAAERTAFFTRFAALTGLGDELELVSPADMYETAVLWRDERLVLGQTCWGPMRAGLEGDVRVLAQPDYSSFEGGCGAQYQSAFVAREAAQTLEGARFAYNELGSLSGYLAPDQDLAKGIGGTFASVIETGSHRASVAAVAEGRADVAAIDCRTWDLAKRYEPYAKGLLVLDWTKPRLGLPYICSPKIDHELAEASRQALLRMGCFAPQHYT